MVRIPAGLDGWNRARWSAEEAHREEERVAREERAATLADGHAAVGALDAYE